MNCEFIDIPERIIIGRYLTLPITDHAVFPLWKQFRMEQSAHGLLGVDLYAMQSYAEWPPKTSITHWAGIEKQEDQEYPQEWSSIHIGGKFASSIFQGTKTEFPMFVSELIAQFLPTTGYQFDESRVHVQIMNHQYSLQDPEAQELVLIPVQKKED